jgi:hypothetical protein
MKLQKLILVLVACLVCGSAFSNDKLAGGIKAGSTSVSLPLELRKSADSTSLTGIVYTGVTGSYWRQGGTRTAITPATLSGPSSSYSSGGFVEVDATNMPGVYRFDVPDAAFATGADWVVVSLKVATAFQLNFMFALESVGAAELGARIPAALTGGGNIKADALYIGGTAQTGRDIGASVLLAASQHVIVDSGTITTYTGNTPQTGDSYALIGAAGAGLTALGDTRIAHLNADISSRMATYTQPTGFLVATFPTTVASTTNITAGTITTTTNLTNLPSIPSNWLTAAGINSGALNGKGDWNTTTPPTSATIAGAVWDVTLSGHSTIGTTGNALNAASASGDPWSTLLPGSYASGTAGGIIGRMNVAPTNLPAVVVLAPLIADQLTGYIQTLDAKGAPQTGITFIFQLVSATGTGASYSSQPFTAKSDSNALLQAPFAKGQTYQGKRGPLGANAKFTVPSTPDGNGGFQLPLTLGVP